MCLQGTWTDGQTDGWTGWFLYTPPNFVCREYNDLLWKWWHFYLVSQVCLKIYYHCLLFGTNLSCNDLCMYRYHPHFHSLDHSYLFRCVEIVSKPIILIKITIFNMIHQNQFCCNLFTIERLFRETFYKRFTDKFGHDDLI